MDNVQSMRRQIIIWPFWLQKCYDHDHDHGLLFFSLKKNQEKSRTINKNQEQSRKIKTNQEQSRQIKTQQETNKNNTRTYKNMKTNKTNNFIKTKTNLHQK